MAEALDPSAVRWSLRRARRERKSAEFLSSLRPSEILDESLNAEGLIVGPYETQYAVARGYCDTTNVIRP